MNEPNRARVMLPLWSNPTLTRGSFYERRSMKHFNKLSPESQERVRKVAIRLLARMWSTPEARAEALARWKAKQLTAKELALPSTPNPKKD